MNSGTPKDKQRERRMMVAAIAMLITAGGVFGGYFYLQRSTVNEADRIRLARGFPTSDQTEAATQKSLAKAVVLRGKWQSWAVRHKELLHAMLQATPSEMSKLVAVQNVVPNRLDRSNTEKPDSSEITSADLIGDSLVRQPDNSWKVNRDPLAVSFSWHTPIRNKAMPSDPELRKKTIEGDKFLSELQKAEFREKKDFQISSSQGPGYEVGLWVSGRITKRTWPVIATKKSDSVGERPFTEVQPPYDFLQ